MTPQPAHMKKLRIALAAVAALSTVALLFLGYDIGRRAFSPANAVREPATATGPGGSSVSANPFEFSVLAEPRALPEIHFADDRGHDLTLADLRGRVVLLNLWATWCVPCRREMPALDRLEATLGGPGFEVVALSIDRRGLAAIQPFFKELGLKALHLYADQSGKAAGALGAPGLPTTLLIDRQGRELGRVVGPADWDDPKIAAVIRDHLARQATAASAAPAKPH